MKLETWNMKLNLYEKEVSEVSKKIYQRGKGTDSPRGFGYKKRGGINQ